MLYYHASLSDYLVVGTTDKSEWSIGFYDRYGDGASDITLVQHLYKTQIKELARFLGVPEEIIQKPSSGDLAAGIPNEVFIGLNYEQLDMILYGLEHEIPDENIIAQTGVNKKAVQTVKQASQRARFRDNLPLHL
jgi:NAD+ synthase